MSLPFQPDPKNPGTLVGEVEFNGTQIGVRINPDGDDLKLCLEAAERGIPLLPKIDARAKAVAERELRSAYNDEWRHYDEQQDDGTYKAVEEPELSAADFQNRLSMIAFDLTGPECWTVSYEDGGMFGGHLVIVTSFDGDSFEDADADLFG